jgi:hypothetical protein
MEARRVEHTPHRPCRVHFRLMVLPPYIRQLAPYLDIEIGSNDPISMSCKVDSDWNLRPV